VDAGSYTGSWENAAAYFRRAVKSEDWVSSMAAFRAPFGTNAVRRIQRTRFVTSLPGAPDGEYVLIQYQSSFERKKQAVETVTMMHEPDGQWRVSGYFIK
jgi:hypothetical protein